MFDSDLKRPKYSMSTIFHSLVCFSFISEEKSLPNTAWLSDSYRWSPQLILDMKDLLKVNHCLDSQHNQGNEINTLGLLVNPAGPLP